jgi:hypothetical protein
LPWILRDVIRLTGSKKAYGFDLWRRHMKLLAFLGLLLTTSTVYGGDIQGLYDGRSGVSCYKFNGAAAISWKRKGGDWIDKNGTMWGGIPFATARYAPQTLVNVTGVGNELFLRLNYGVRFGSRESGTPPKLHLTLSDGSTRTLRPTADSSIDCSTVTPLGTGLILGRDSVIRFPALPKHTKAVLELTGVTSTTTAVTLRCIA